MKNNCEIGLPCYDNINWFIPIDDVDLEKSEEVQGDSRYDKMYLSGTASDETRDTDGEIMETDGFMLDRFLAEGTINYEHMAKTGGPKYIIGEPVEAKVKDGKFFIKAKLWKGRKIAEDLWDTLLIMKANKSKRRLGWSIEGKALLRDIVDNKRVKKALITHCALTFSPKNYNTFADIVKGEQTVDFVKYEYDESANGGQEYLLDMTMPNGTRITIDKSMKIKIYKAMSAGHQSGTELTGKITTGASLKKESVDKKITDLKKAIEVVSDYQNRVGFDKKSAKIIKKSILTFVK